MWFLYGFEDIRFDLWFFYSREPLKTFSLKTDFLFYVDLEFPLYKQTSTTSTCHTANSPYMRNFVCKMNFDYFDSYATPQHSHDTLDLELYLYKQTSTTSTIHTAYSPYMRIFL